IPRGHRLRGQERRLGVTIHEGAQGLRRGTGKAEAAGMISTLRKTGISILGEVPWGTHLCHFYESQLDLFSILAPYFKAGLEEHEYCLWAVDEPFTTQMAKGALRQVGPAFEKHLADRDIEIV